MKTKLICGIAALAFGLLVWPTPYRYRTVRDGFYSRPITARINHVTGRLDYLQDGNWKFVHAGWLGKLESAVSNEFAPKRIDISKGIVKKPAK